MKDKINKKKIAVLIVIGVIVAISAGFIIYQIIRIKEKYFHVSYNDVSKITINGTIITDEELKKNIIEAYNDLDNVDIDPYGQIGTPACSIRIYLKSGTKISIDNYISVYVYKKDETYWFNARNKYLEDLMKEYIEIGEQ